MGKVIITTRCNPTMSTYHIVLLPIPVLFLRRFADHHLGLEGMCGWHTGSLLGHADPINQIKDKEFICHISMKPMKSNAGPRKCNLRGHGRKNETEAIKNDAKREDAAPI